MLFEAALGIDSGLLMRLQLNYNIQIASRDESFTNRLAEIRKTAVLL
jgi:hypothetical protein